jgi:glycosyltransferase involved in cell wall biosynthesis
MEKAEPDADVFFVYGQALVFAAGMYRRRGVKPVVVYLDSHLDVMEEAHRGIGRFQRIKHFVWIQVFGLPLARRVDRFIAVSPYLRDRFVSLGFPKDTFSIVPDAFVFGDSGAQKRGKVPLTLLYVGRLSKEKGVDNLLSALRNLPDDLWRLRIVGDGPERGFIERAIESEAFVGRIELSKWMDVRGVESAYSEADVLVVPSKVAEPFGRVIVEAMHAGLPVVVPEKGGASWVAGEAGVLFENGSAASLCGAIRSLEDAKKREALGKSGEIRAKSFTATIVAKELDQILMDITAEQKKG